MQTSNQNLEELTVFSGMRTFHGWQEYCGENERMMLSAAEFYALAKEKRFTLAQTLQEKKLVFTSTFVSYDAQHPHSGIIAHLSSQKEIKIDIPYILTRISTLPHLEALFKFYPCTQYFQALFGTKDAKEEILETLEILTGMKAKEIKFMNSTYEFRRFCSEGVVAFRKHRNSAVLEGDMTPFAQIASAVVTSSNAP